MEGLAVVVVGDSWGVVRKTVLKKKRPDAKHTPSLFRYHKKFRYARTLVQGKLKD